MLCNRDWKNDSKRLPFINEANFISIFRDSTNWNRKKNSPGGSLRKRGMKASTPSSRNLSTVQTSKTKNGCRPNSPSFIPGAGKRISMRHLLDVCFWHNLEKKGKVSIWARCFRGPTITKTPVSVKINTISAILDPIYYPIITVCISKRASHPQNIRSPKAPNSKLRPASDAKAN